MVGNIKGNFYALPMVNEAQQSSLLALLPPNATQTVDKEAEDCQEHPCQQLPDQVMAFESDASVESGSQGFMKH